MSILMALVLSQYSYVYKTDFTKREWGAFQEVVTSCYSADAGRVYLDAGVLTVASNFENTYHSNHLIGQRNVSKAGFTSANTYYSIDFYVDSNSADWLTYPEDGPEISIQVTRYISSQYQTATAGFQYAANPWAGARWHYWNQAAPLSGNWYDTTGPSLTWRHWYKFETLVDYVANKYKWARVCEQDGGSCQYLGVDGGDLGVNLKWGEEGSWITCEAENLWQATCGSPSGLQLKVNVLYDNAFLSY